MRALHLFMICLVFGVMLSRTAQAQRKSSPDLVTFQDKSEFRGVITEYKPDELLKMTVGGEEIIIDGAQLARVNKIKLGHYNYLQTFPGFWKELQLGFSAGKSSGYSITEYFTLINLTGGYQFNQYLGLGLGSGFQRYRQIDIIPVYATIRGSLTNKRVAPIYYTDIGYGIGLLRDIDPFIGGEADAKGGLLVGTGVGIQMKMKSIYLTGTVGYKLQQSEISRSFSPVFFDTRFAPTSGEEFVENRNSNRVEWKIGIGF